MVWFNVDDGFHAHPKAVHLSLAARGLWVTAGAWSACYLTDGVIPRIACSTWGIGNARAINAAAKELVENNLWRESVDGWEFVNWLEYQRSREEVEGKRAKDRSRKNRQRRGSGGKYE